MAPHTVQYSMFVCGTFERKAHSSHSYNCINMQSAIQLCKSRLTDLLKLPRNPRLASTFQLMSTERKENEKKHCPTILRWHWFPCAKRRKKEKCNNWKFELEIEDNYDLIHRMMVLKMRNKIVWRSNPLIFTFYCRESEKNMKHKQYESSMLLR